MKIFKFLFIALTIFGLTSCSNDDDNSTVELTIDNVVGTYDVVLLQGSEVVTDNSTGVVVVTRQITTDTFTNAIFIFNTDGTYSSSGSFRATLTETITGQNPTSESEIQSLDDDGLSFSVDTANRTITLDGQLGNVTLFDGINLYINLERTDTFNGNTTVFNTELRLRKQS